MPSTRERVEEAYNVLARWLRELSRTICASVDSGGNVYVAEVTYTIAGRDGLVPENCHDFQKFVPVNPAR